MRFAWPFFSYNVARTALFALEYEAFQGLSNLYSKISNNKSLIRKPDPKLLAHIRQSTLSLLAADAKNIQLGIYPANVLWPESPKKHMRRLPYLFFDGLRAFYQRDTGKTAVFKSKIKKNLENYPRYYRRNFHFQNQGYLSDESAFLYEHQVEILFRGSADAMRRSMLAPLVEFAGKRSRIRLLEIGAGTGRMSKFVKLALPQAHLTVSDLSPSYLKRARSQLKDMTDIDFIEADGASLPFKDGSFDGVYSVFLFHELPLKERIQVLAECKRVVKPGGFIGLVDSLQNGDVPDFDFLLEEFPKTYHEPFYRNYASHPMENLAKSAGLKPIHKSINFVSKTLCYLTCE